MRESNFESDYHTLYVGWVCGMARKHGLDPTPIGDEEGNYTDAIEITMPGGPTITVIIPPPPDGWALTDE